MDANMKKMATATYVVDLTQIEGDGDFLCPCCGTLISPDDQSDTSYTIEDVKMHDGKRLHELIIRCAKCRSSIHITGPFEG
jgi:predicted RNA-binding Zn-ribbon protein involved in translation (DUF1610 family)